MKEIIVEYLKKLLLKINSQKLLTKYCGCGQLYFDFKEKFLLTNMAKKLVAMKVHNRKIMKML